MTIRQCTASITGTSYISFSRAHETEKLDRELHDAYERRTFMNKLHIDPAGRAYIPASAFKQALDAAVKFRGEKIPGKGNHTYSKHFVGGVLCTDDAVLFGENGKPHTADTSSRVRIHANADGIRGSGKRVWRIFPQFTAWRADVQFALFDDLIVNDVFEQHFRDAGLFIGVGQYRPQNGGTNGRWRCDAFDWSVIG